VASDLDPPRLRPDFVQLMSRQPSSIPPRPPPFAEMLSGKPAAPELFPNCSELLSPKKALLIDLQGKFHGLWLDHELPLHNPAREGLPTNCP